MAKKKEPTTTKQTPVQSDDDLKWTLGESLTRLMNEFVKEVNEGKINMSIPEFLKVYEAYTQLRRHHVREMRILWIGEDPKPLKGA
jgi:hypothetical protein